MSDGQRFREGDRVSVKLYKSYSPAVPVRPTWLRGVYQELADGMHIVRLDYEYFDRRFWDVDVRPLALLDRLAEV